MNSRLAPLVLAGLLFPLTSLAQQAQDNTAQPNPTVVVATPPPPATLLEIFLAKKNAIIVKGFTEIATVTGEDNATIRIIAVEVTNPAKEFPAITGLAIEVHSQGDRTAASYIDAEEIDGLINAIDYLTKAEASVTQLANFTVQYHTKGDLELSNFSGDGTRLIGIKSVQILPTTNQLVAATAFFRVATMGELRQQLIAGQQALEKIKAPAR